MYFSCFEKSSFSSSSSQLSSQRCALPPGTSASSCVQSARREICQHTHGCKGGRGPSILECSPSTGKSSNSSSSSSIFGCEGCCEVLAGSISGFLSSCSFAVELLPAAAPDILDVIAIKGGRLSGTSTMVTRLFGGGLSWVSVVKTDVNKQFGPDLDNNLSFPGISLQKKLRALHYSMTTANRPH